MEQPLIARADVRLSINGPLNQKTKKKKINSADEKKDEKKEKKKKEPISNQIPEFRSPVWSKSNDGLFFVSLFFFFFFIDYFIYVIFFFFFFIRNNFDLWIEKWIELWIINCTSSSTTISFWNQ